MSRHQILCVHLQVLVHKLRKFLFVNLLYFGLLFKSLLITKITGKTFEQTIDFFCVFQLLFLWDRSLVKKYVNGVLDVPVGFLKECLGLLLGGASHGAEVSDDFFLCFVVSAFFLK